MQTHTIVVADAGSTKISWGVCRPNYAPEVVTTAGFNAVTARSDDFCKLYELCVEAVSETGLPALSVEEVHYYGAGCATAAINTGVASALRCVFPHAEIYVGSDLEGAARALFGEGDGIACILGTGSNSCLWRGGSIEANVPPLGYILGDEGSGASLGRRLVRQALRGALGQRYRDELERDYGVTREETLQRVYRSPGGNVWLASLVPFLGRHRNSQAVQRILAEEFGAFLDNNVALYNAADMDMPVGFVGSVAHFFEVELRTAMAERGYRLARIVRSPIDALLTSPR